MELIEKIIKKRPHKCEKNYICLTNAVDTCCKVVNCIDGKLHFIDYTSNSYCHYKMSFGYSNICTCEARKEIFNLKGI